MTEELFRQDAYLRQCDASVLTADENGIITDKTVCYAMSGGQPGDCGVLTWEGGEIPITDTRKSDGGILHVLEPGHEKPSNGAPVQLSIDWERRHRHMRMHTLMHLVCSSVEGDVTGGQIGEAKSRLDFDLPAGAIDKEALTDRLNDLVQADYPISTRWISEDELDANPSLVRTLSVQPPRGAGKIRLVCIGDPENPIDLQPCGGTHIASTAEIGPVRVGKVENKGRQNRRINLHFNDS